MMQIDDVPETTELATFTRVVEAGSISLAARELGVRRPTVGRRLARLEERLGLRLLWRSGAEATLAVVYVERAFVRPAVRAFVDATVERASRTTLAGRLTRQRAPGALRPSQYCAVMRTAIEPTPRWTKRHASNPGALSTGRTSLLNP
jgi:hypothetical protein